MANQNPNVDQAANDLLEAEADIPAHYKADLEELFKLVVGVATELQATQHEIQRQTSERAGEELGIAYEITDEKLQDPSQLVNLDELTDMVNYYDGKYEEYNTKFKSLPDKRKTRADRAYYQGVSRQFLDAYHQSGKMQANVAKFMKKYEEYLSKLTEQSTQPQPENQNPETEPQPEQEPVTPVPVTPVPVTPVPVTPVPVTPVPGEDKKPSGKKPRKVQRKPDEQKPESEPQPEPEPQPEQEPVTPVTPVPVTPAPGEDKKPTGKKPRKVQTTPGILKGIDPAYYGQIFALINTTVVIGSKYKYNTLDYLEYELKNASIERMQELGFPIDDPEKSQLIKKVCLHLVGLSKEIRKQQWASIGVNGKKEGEFEARKHTVQESIVDRNMKLIKTLRISPDVAAEFGLSTKVEHVEKLNDDRARESEEIAKKTSEVDPTFVQFYEDLKKIEKLGSPTSETKDVLYSVYKEFKTKGENNSFGLKGESLKAAIKLVENAIINRRNTFDPKANLKKNSSEAPERGE